MANRGRRKKLRISDFSIRKAKSDRLIAGADMNRITKLSDLAMLLNHSLSFNQATEHVIENDKYYFRLSIWILYWKYLSPVNDTEARAIRTFIQSKRIKGIYKNLVNKNLSDFLKYNQKYYQNELILLSKLGPYQKPKYFKKMINDSIFNEFSLANECDLEEAKKILKVYRRILLFPEVCFLRKAKVFVKIKKSMSEKFRETDILLTHATAEFSGIFPNLDYEILAEALYKHRDTIYRNI